MMDDAVKISVVIPVYDEAATIGEVIRRVLDCGFETEVIVVDDASTDDTPKYLRSLEHPQVHCFYHAVNRGKGAALRTGFAAARNPYVVVQDADLEYDPREYCVCSNRCSTAVRTWFTARVFSAGHIACFSSGIMWATGC
jgi:hypothetical protein